jgi:putative transcriptional regulator
MNKFCYGDEAIKEPFHYRMCGLDDIYLNSGYERTDGDYGTGVVIQDMDGLHRAIGEFLSRHKKTLNGKEVRFLRHEMDLTQAQLGDIMRVTDQTVARWEKQEVPIPGPAEMLLRALYLGHAAKAVDVLALAAELRANDAPTSDKQHFAPTDHGWQAIAA